MTEQLPAHGAAPSDLPPAGDDVAATGAPLPAIDESEPPIERRSIRRNLAAMLSSQLVTWALATVLAVIVPRYLPPEVTGDLRLAQSLWTIAAIFIGLGTSQFLQLEVARRPRDGLGDVGPVLALRSVAWIVALAVIAAYAVGVDGTENFIVLAALVGVVALITSWSEVLGTSFLGLERMSTPALAAVVAKAFNVVAVIVVLVLGGGVYGVVAVAGLSSLVALVQIYWHYRKIAGFRFAGWSRQVRRIVSASFPFMLAGAGLVVYQQIDVVVISWVAGREDLGWYTTADLLVGSLLFPATALVATIFPVLGRLHEHDPDALRNLVQRSFSLLLLLGAPIAAGTMLVAPTFAPTLFGEDYREVGDVLVALGPMILVTFGTILFGMTALATERGKLWVIVLFTSAALTVPLDLLLVPWASDRFDNGAIGGAVAYIITETFQFTVGLVVVVPYLVRWRNVWLFARVLLAAGIMAAAVWPVRELFVVVPAAVGAAVYGLAVLALRLLDPDDVAVLRGAARGRF